MELSLFDSKGKRLNKKVKLDETVFNCTINEKIIEQCIYVYLSNQRESLAHTKVKSEVRGGGRKPWRQKGTGRARHGSIRSPIWKGGGIVFGPRKDRNYKKKLNKNIKRLAIKGVFSWFLKNKKILVIDNIEFKNKHLTKQLVDITNKLGISKNILYIYSGKNKELYLASRNIEKINVLNVDEINAYILLRHNYIVIFKDALKNISNKWGLQKQKENKIDKKLVKKSVIKNKVLINKEELSEDFHFTIRLRNILKKQGINNKKDLKKLFEKGKKIEGIGKQSMDKLKNYLES